MKKLRNYLTSLSFFKKTKESNNESFDYKKLSIPDEISDSEKIERFIYSPFHLNKKKTKVVAGAFKTPLGIDEVSVNRYDFTNANYCKKLGKDGQNLPNRTFFGLAMLHAN